MDKKILIAIILIVLAVVTVLFLRQNNFKNEKLPNTSGIDQLPEADRGYFQTLIDGIRSGGPPKDGIPAVDKPKYESAIKANEWLKPNDIVFGLLNDGKPVAYPQRIVVWHEIVNETVDGVPSSITYCPLTGTVIGFKNPHTDSTNPTLGVSGKLVNSNLIMYDRETDSYWPQILGKSILGSDTGASLEEFPITWTTWEKWKKKYPQTEVLSKDTGFFRNYDVGGDPYGSYLEESGYYFTGGPIFPPINQDDRLSPKEVVVGIRDNDRNAVAILKDKVRSDKQIEFELGEKTVVIKYDSELDFYSAKYKDSGKVVNAFDSLWFPWASFYPETKLIK